MKLLKNITFILITVKSIETSNNTKIRNSEIITISLGDFNENLDDLEIIPESKDHDLMNEKLAPFHNFIKNFKPVHPWEKLFIKDVEYEKSKNSYTKIIRDTIRRIKHRKKRVKKKNILEMESLSYAVKRKPPVIKDHYDNSDDDDDDDEDNDDNKNEVEIPQSVMKEMKNEYDKEAVKEEEERKAFKYSDEGKPEESVKDAFEKILDIKTPPNCTNITGFGVVSVECLAKSYRDHEINKKDAFRALMKIIFYWIVIYIFIAVPCWCIRGWCCCCIKWKYCKPKKLVEEVEKYIADNPPGIYINEEGEEEHYEPSPKEKELYERIRRKIIRL